MNSLRCRILCTAALAAGAAALGAAAPASADTTGVGHDLQNVTPTKVLANGALTGAGALTGGVGMVPGALGMVPGAVGGLGMVP
ncbi:hypothetical protein [Streptacidiphilus anmyonensis]|uniref:hypothetical protein n=1 Tax=Streptacidiphilus anmyonensis TaxID=405782 RepID=UPI0005A7D06F|nr:hypothetical protein [Streptacidiphilus anmyonensis]